VSLSDDILVRLPDVPRWVAIRGMLRSGRGRIIGTPVLEPLAAVVLREETGLMTVAGRPPAKAIRLAAQAAGEIVTAPEDEAWVKEALTSWTVEDATLFALPDGPPASAGSTRLATARSTPGGLKPAVPGPGGLKPAVPEIRFLGPGDREAVARLPAELAEEITVGLDAGIAVGAAFADGAPVSFCLADSETEGLWDVAVETVDSHRRRGYALALCRFMIAFHAARGRRPVWGSAASNPASARLAEKLGLRPFDDVRVFTR
jgi:GNAT superfamily N-acetyltransferase